MCKKYLYTITLTLILTNFPTSAAKAVTSISIDPTVRKFDSIPRVDTELRFFVGTVQDTSLERDETGVVGTTRIRKRKTAPIVCTPSPAIVVKRSVEGLLTDRELKASEPDSADYIIRIFVLDFRLTESSRRIGQTMEADISMEIMLVNGEDTAATQRYIIKSQNSKSTIDTSKHAESILRGALENALKELIKTITR